jgi:hypothetical protein
MEQLIARCFSEVLGVQVRQGCVVGGLQLAQPNSCEQWSDACWLSGRFKAAAVCARISKSSTILLSCTCSMCEEISSHVCTPLWGRWKQCLSVCLIMVVRAAAAGAAAAAAHDVC